MKSKLNRIDLHHHFFSAEIQAEMKKRNIEYTGGMGVPPWSMESALATMERHEIAVAIASIQPFVHWNDPEFATRWSRLGNEFLARTVDSD